MTRMTDYRDFFKRAVGATHRKYTFSDENDIIKSVKERENGMYKKNEKHGHFLLGIAAGTAAGIAVIGTGALGLAYLAEHGGLKGTDVQGGAGYSSNAETTTAASKGFDYILQSYSSNGSGYVNIDQRYGVGDDLTVHLKGYRFDGIWAKIYYDLIFKDEITDGLSSVPVLPKDSDIGHRESCQIAGSGTQFSCFADYRLYEPSESAEVEFGYSDDPQSQIFGLTMFKSTDMIDEPIVTTAVYMTVPDDVETTTATAVLPYESEDDTTTTVTADTQENGVMLDFSSRTVSMEDYSYDGHILAAKLVGEADVINGKSLAFRSVSDPRNLIQGCLQEYGGTYTMWALLDVPEGQTDTIEIVEIPPASDGIEVGATITVDGTATSSPGIVLDADMSGYGLPGVTLESMRLSTYGLELMFSCDKSNGAQELHIEILLDDIMVPIREISSVVPYDETDGLYHACKVVTAENMFGFDLSAASSVSVNGLKVSGDELTPGGADNRPGIYDIMPRRNIAAEQPAVITAAPADSDQ